MSASSMGRSRRSLRSLTQAHTAISSITIALQSTDNGWQALFELRNPTPQFHRLPAASPVAQETVQPASTTETPTEIAPKRSHRWRRSPPTLLVYYASRNRPVLAFSTSE
jgi:hypothetical protein